MSSRSHIRPMASPTRPRPTMATVCPGPPPDVDARHLTEVILGALGRRMLGSSATDVGEPAVDIARAPAGRRGARRPKVPTQYSEIASKPNRSLSFCGPNFAKIGRVGKPRRTRHYAPRDRGLSPRRSGRSPGHRPAPSEARCGSIQAREDARTLPLLGRRAGKTEDLSHAQCAEEGFSNCRRGSVELSRRRGGVGGASKVI